MALTASKLRDNIYRILDQVLDTGVPVEVVRKGRTVRIVAAEPPARLDRMRPRDYLVGDPEAIVHLDWSEEWRP
jgi:prevent-host-death family protein